MNSIDRIFVINLDKRQDRLLEFMEECDKMGIQKVERFSAIHRPDHGALGCTLSHLNVIKLAKKRNYKNVLIFEDDFTFTINRPTLDERLQRFFNQNIPYKVLMFAYSLYDTHPAIQYDDDISTISYAANAAGYLVDQSCYDELIHFLSYGAMMLEKTREHWNYINDQVWKHSQSKGGWFIFNQRVGVQRDSFSDLRQIYISKYDGFEYHHLDLPYHESIHHGRCEPYTGDLQIVNKYLSLFPHKNRGFIDIGSHVGTTVMPFMKYYQECIAYEPHPEHYQFLCHNVRINQSLFGTKRIHPKPYAISMSPFVTLHHAGYNSGCFYAEPNNEGGQGTVKAICLDDDDDVKKMEIDFIKIDTYGSDLDVIEGSFDTIRRTRPLVQVGHGRDNRDRDKIVDLFESIGGVIFDQSISSHTYFYFPNETHCIVPRTVFCFWTGPTAMSENRQNCLANIPNHTLVTPNNLSKYILQGHPLHPAYIYLSETHRADYLRTYFMHFYGGGYTDIKLQGGSWEDSFKKMEKGQHYACGYKEIGPNGVGNDEVRSKWENLIGNGAYIFLPNTSFTKKWYSEMLKYLDSIYPVLVNNPAKSPRDCIEHDPTTTYPIGWARMLGYIFHPINYEFHEWVLQCLPQPLFYHYL